ncbi:MAG: RsmB/NOP family class I SAM-dependent RNA methyltransferase [Candidatus Omnitrophica bacterium]|nr:RsmB/NOP family class I SAM-dependent RNA methyltransferase [Candidatus Omnitrophota bacterium]
MKPEVRKLPELFLERLRRIVPSQKWDAVANTFAEPKPTTFRVNTLKAKPEVIQEKLHYLGFRLEKVSWCPGAFILRDGRLRELQETEIYKKGEIYVQNLSSMIPVLVLNPQPGETILDLTAAPGSKTTQMAVMMKGEGRLVANDNDRIRFFKLKTNVELQGASNVELKSYPGEQFGRHWPDYFDRVLLDAPCTAEGRFLAHEPSTYRYWKPAKIKEMARKQKNLILSAFRALKPGGTLVYSTCTFAPEENEGVLTWLLEKADQHKIPAELVEVRHAPPLPSIPNPMHGLSAWEEKNFHPSVRNSIRILPTVQMEGFFVASLRKKE